jgi:hypothetical protein
MLDHGGTIKNLKGLKASKTQISTLPANGIKSRQNSVPSLDKTVAICNY